MTLVRRVRSGSVAGEREMEGVSPTLGVYRGNG